MKNSLIIMAFLYASVDVIAQEHSMDTIRNNIVFRDSLLTEKLSNQTRIDILLNQVNDLKIVSNMFKDSCETLSAVNFDIQTELEMYRTLISPDTSVFHTSFTNMAVPKCLEPHIALIMKISDLNKTLEEVYNRIETLKQTLSGDDVDEIIANQIEEDMFTMNDVFNQIWQSDLSTLSEEQMAFLKPGLTEKYNNLITYFE